MTHDDGLSSYVDLLTRPTPERALLQEVPWQADAQLQPSAGLASALQLEAERFAELRPGPLFSIITPLFDTEPRHLEEVGACCRLQSWQRWELLLVDDGSTRREHLAVARGLAATDARIRLIELPERLGISGARNVGAGRASGDYVAFLDHDDLLHPQALGVFAMRVARDPGLDLLFSNEAKIDDGSRMVSEFLSKPALDLFTLLRVNYVAHFTAVKRSALTGLQAREGLVFRPQFDGVEDHDLFLRLALHGSLRTAHVPLFLYYWRRSITSTASSLGTKPDVVARGAAMLHEHLTRLHGRDADEVHVPGPGRLNTRFSLRPRGPASDPRPTLTVVVPFRDGASLTLRCLDALERQEHSLEVQVLLVDNGSTDPRTQASLSAWKRQARRNRYEVVRDDGAFNFARLNNLAAREHARGRDLLLFLNNDVELVSADCLQTLAVHLLRDATCGVAGIRLVYPGGQRIQHGGLKVSDSFAGSGYYGVGHARDASEFVTDEHVVLGVTFACAMMRRATYEALGGLDEHAFPNAFGDVDICLRAIEAGHHNHYFGTLEGVHHESATRERMCEDVEFAALHERHGGTLARWRLRQLAFELQPRWVERTKDIREEGALRMPLRHHVADGLNDALKRALGGWHHAVKVRLERRARARAPRPPARDGDT